MEVVKESFCSTLRKDYMNLEARLIKLKDRLGKIAPRDPRSAKDYQLRIKWERVRRILQKRYDRED